MIEFIERLKASTEEAELLRSVMALLIGRAAMRGIPSYDPKDMLINHEIGHAVVAQSLGHPPAKIVISSNGGLVEPVNPFLTEPIDLTQLRQDPVKILPGLLILIAGYAGEAVLSGEDEPPTHIAAHEIAMTFFLCQFVGQCLNQPAGKIYTALFDSACEIIRANLKLAERLKTLLKNIDELAGEGLSRAISDICLYDHRQRLKNALNSGSDVNRLYLTMERSLSIIGAATTELKIGLSKSLESRISAIMARHTRAIVGFSGGKESIAIAHMLEPYKDKVELVWVNTGAMFPHMEEFVREYGRRFRLTELSSNQTQRFATAGLPSRVVPIANVPIKNRDNRERLLINDWMSCCFQLRTKPIYDYMVQVGATLLIHGQRQEDQAYFSPGPELQGAEVFAPLDDWSQQQVLDYIEAHSLQLPEQYPEVMDSLECWNCTATLSPERFKYMREHYPILLDRLRPALGAVYTAVAVEMNNNAKALQSALINNYEKGFDT